MRMILPKKNLFLLILTLSVSFPMALQADPGENQTPSSTVSQTFALIDQLAARYSIDPNTIEKMTGLKLKQNIDASNKLILIYETETLGAGDFIAAELRLPLKINAPFTWFLILEASPNIKITREDIFAKYGKRMITSPPKPGMPPNTPIYYTYDHPWGKLSFGIDAGKTPYLREIIFDIGKPASS